MRLYAPAGFGSLPAVGPMGPFMAGHARDAKSFSLMSPGVWIWIGPFRWRAGDLDPRPYGDLIVVRRDAPISYHLPQ